VTPAPPTPDTPRRVVLVRPGEGGVAYVAASVATELRGRGAAVTELVGSERDWPALDGARTVWRHRKAIRAADVVHVELGLTALSAVWIAAWTALLRGDLVTVLHDGPDMVKSPGSGVIRTAPGWRDAAAHKLAAPVLDGPLRALLRRRTRQWVVLSDRARRDLEAAGFAPVAVVPLGADAPTATVAPSLGTTVVFAGFIAQSKGLDGLLDAWESVGPTTPLHLHIVGGHRRQYDEYVDGLARRIDGMDGVTLDGWASDEAFNTAIAGAALVVLPYLKSNPVSGVLIRAAVEGRAVIATTVPAFADRVEDGVTAVLIPPGDTGALTDALASLVGDGARRDALGKAAAEWARTHCTWAAQVDALTAAYGPGPAPAADPATQ